MEILKEKSKFLVGVYRLATFKRDPRRFEAYLKKELSRPRGENCPQLILEIIHHFISSGQLTQAESALKQIEKEIMPTETELYNEMICLQVCARAAVIKKKYAQQYTKKSVDERIKNIIRITSVLEVATTKRLIRIAASMLWNQLLPLLEPQLKLNELDKYVIGALNMIVSHDPMNENAYKCCRELSRFALSKENLTAASRHLIHAVSLCNDETMKQKMHQEARMISAAVNPYNRPENQLEQAGKLVQEANIAPVNKINPILVQTGRLLSSEFMERYNGQKKLQEWIY